MRCSPESGQEDPFPFPSTTSDPLARERVRTPSTGYFVWATSAEREVAGRNVRADLVMVRRMTRAATEDPMCPISRAEATEDRGIHLQRVRDTIGVA